MIKKLNVSFFKSKAIQQLFRWTLAIVDVPTICKRNLVFISKSSVMSWITNLDFFIDIFRFESLLYSAANSAKFKKEITNNIICNMNYTNQLKKSLTHCTVYYYNQKYLIHHVDIKYGNKQWFLT